MTKEELQAAVVAARKVLADAEAAVLAFDALPENNIFTSLDEAEGKLYERMHDQAREDCEGAGNCGFDQYTQVFIVDGTHYLGTLAVEYDRHDKTYYYIDRARFTYEPAPAPQPAAE